MTDEAGKITDGVQCGGEDYLSGKKTSYSGKLSGEY